MKLKKNLVIAVLWIGAIVLLIAGNDDSSLAQRGDRESGGGRWRMDPEVQTKVWDLQSQSVAQDLGLAEEATAKLAATYKGAREKAQEAMVAAFQEGGGDWQQRREQFQKIRDEQVEAFTKDLKEFLDESQTEKALQTLGSFSRFWDSMTRSLSEIVENEETLQKAVLEVGSQLAKIESDTSGDRRERYQKMREEINAALKKILSEEEYAKWEEASQNRRRGPRS